MTLAGAAYMGSEVCHTFLRLKRNCKRGERMRNILAVLLVVGLLIGTFCVMEGFQEISDGEQIGYDVDYPGIAGNPAPCGSGEGGGGGPGGQPG